MNHLGDTNKMVSDTPRMKAAQMAAMEHGTGDVWRVGCDIERELKAANGEIERLTAKVAQLREGAEEQKQRIKRLEEALWKIEAAMKLPASNHRLMQIAGPARQVINIVKQAKEAKP